MLQQSHSRAGLEDAWGEDGADPAATSSSSTLPSLARRQRGAMDRSQVSSSSQHASSSDGVPTLQAICLGVLAVWLEELIEAGEQVLSLLTAEARAALLAVARHKGLLTDHVLALLLHDEWHTLNLAGQHRVTAPGLLHALQHLPFLEVLDISRCCVPHSVISQLGHMCPRLQVLRLGHDSTTDAALTRALPSLSPQVQQHDHQSWEQLDETTPQLQTGRLARLSYIIWPSMPAKAGKILAEKAPRICLNPDPRKLALPPEADARLPADAAAMELVGQFEWPAPESCQSSAAVSLPERPPIADLFKAAYEDRDQRKAAKAERNYRQALARQWRASPCLRAIRLAEMGVPL
ncbi:hypothetical protein WJX73_000037 [Symbiochloris irregularis]|uniref:Uncharacterized protein n=1 Tax=Symbiochloris irregularis TaxID=706552 RepID=A0AAW1PRP6_9CHLO